MKHPDFRSWWGIKEEDYIPPIYNLYINDELVMSGDTLDSLHRPFWAAIKKIAARSGDVLRSEQIGGITPDQSRPGRYIVNHQCTLASITTHIDADTWLEARGARAGFGAPAD